MHASLLAQDFLASFQARNEYFLGALVTVKAGDGPGSPLQVRDARSRPLMSSCLMRKAHPKIK
jgi:hypothetical protein